MIFKVRTVLEHAYFRKSHLMMSLLYITREHGCAKRLESIKVAMSYVTSYDHCQTQEGHSLTFTRRNTLGNR